MMAEILRPQAEPQNEGASTEDTSALLQAGIDGPLIDDDVRLVMNSSEEDIQNDLMIVDENNEEEIVREPSEQSSKEVIVVEDGDHQDEDEETTAVVVQRQDNEEHRDKDEQANEEASIESASKGDDDVGASSFIYKCVFCERSLSASDEPKLMECLHNACASCISNNLYDQNVNSGENKGNIECASCSLLCSANNIIENQFVIELANTEDNSSTKLTDIKCSNCGDDVIASSFCVNCSEYICDNCVQAHQRLKITKDHTIKSKDEACLDNQAGSSAANSLTLHCNIHPKEVYTIFCEDCDQLTCRDCQLVKHRNHNYKFIREMAIDARKSIATMLKDVNYKRTLLNTAVQVIDERHTLIAEKKQALVKEITNLVVKLTNTINVRGKQLVARLNEVCEQKQKTLTEKRVALNQLSKMTDHCIGFTKHALESGSDMALLFSKRQLTSHLHRVKCKRADIPNPEIPVRIHLALDKVPDLIKVISTIGQIVVDGKIYPTPTSSPANSLASHGSPSPVLIMSKSPHQESPLSHTIHYPSQQQHHQNFNQQPQQQQLQQQQHFAQQQQTVNYPSQQQPGYPPPPQQQQGQQGNFQQHLRMPPPYSQYTNQSGGVQNSNMHQNMGSNNNRPNNMMAPNMQQSLAQHLQQTMPHKVTVQRNNPNRPLLPITSRLVSIGLNHQQQQQVSSSTHPQGLMHERENLRGLLQPNNNTVYVQTGPSQYQAVQPQFAQQYQNRFASANSAATPNQQQPMQQQQQQQQQQHQQQQQQFRQQQQGIQQAPRSGNLVHQQQQYRVQMHRGVMQNQDMRNNLPTTLSNLVSSGNSGSGGGGSGGGAKWHIPQQNNMPETIGAHLSNVTVNRAQILPPAINDNFKITLRAQNTTTTPTTVPPATVSSTIPKTPSPNLGGKLETTEQSLDKYCQDSVNDLMATIAKLDSNGVQVLAEGRQKTGGSPHVDSSTDDISGIPVPSKPDAGESGKDDPNEDWCAVCMDGGELVCCDKCPKVFHQFCHIPNLSVEESDTWQCLLCVNFADMPETEQKFNDLTTREKKLAERLVLELYCQYEPSLPFREVIGIDNVDYHSIIKKPIALDTIRHKLDWNSSSHYTCLEDLVKDVRLMFSNAFTYNEIDTQVYNDAKNLENFFIQLMDKFLPTLSYEDTDENIQPPSKRVKRIIND